MLSACPAGTPTFSVCVVSSADVMPFPDAGAGGGPWRDSVIAVAATVEAVGVGTAPAQCRDARVFGAPASSDRWLQVRTANDVVWTIGLAGLGTAPVVQIGQSVTLDLELVNARPGPPTIQNPSYNGYVQLSDSDGTPLLWAGIDRYLAAWLSLASGQPLCRQVASSFCSVTRYDVKATINGTVAIVAPFSAVNLAGYTLAVGEYDVLTTALSVHSECNFTALPSFAAAAVKAP
jgi:hypothetical protein